MKWRMLDGRLQLAHEGVERFSGAHRAMGGDRFRAARDQLTAELSRREWGVLPQSDGRRGFLDYPGFAALLLADASESLRMLETPMV